MCIAIPSKLIEKDGLSGLIDVQGARRKVNLMLLPEEAQIGDYLLVHAGFAIQKLDPESGRETLALFDAIIASMASEDEKRNA